MRKLFYPLVALVAAMSIMIGGAAQASSAELTLPTYSAALYQADREAPGKALASGITCTTKDAYADEFFENGYDTRFRLRVWMSWKSCDGPNVVRYIDPLRNGANFHRTAGPDDCKDDAFGGTNGFRANIHEFKQFNPPLIDLVCRGNITSDGQSQEFGSGTYPGDGPSIVVYASFKHLVQGGPDVDRSGPAFTVGY